MTSDENQEYKHFFDKIDLPFDQWFIDLNDYSKKNGKIKHKNYSLLRVVHKKNKSVFSAQKRSDEWEDIFKNAKFLKDLQITTKLNHPSILKLYGISPIDFKNNEKPVIITDFTPYGTLRDFLDDVHVYDDEGEEEEESYQEMNLSQKLIIIYGIASAMNYLHSEHIVFRNLSPEKILLDSSLHPKLFDFSHSFDMEKNIQNEKSELYSDFQYLAPEFFTKNYFCKKSDVFSFSLIVYEILTNCSPFKDVSYSDCITKKIRPELNSTIPDFFKNLLEKCWADDPDDRPSFHEIINALRNPNNFRFLNAEDDITEYLEFIGQKIPSKAEIYLSQIKVDELLVKFDFPSLLKADEKAQISLHDILRKNEQFEGWNYMKKLINMYGIAMGMKYIHSQGCIHRNLSTKSILEDRDFYPKITGFSKIQYILNKSNHQSQDTLKLTRYSAPETIEKGEYSRKSDVYTFAYIMYEIATNTKPFGNYTKDMFHCAVLDGVRPEFDNSVPQFFINLIERCWSNDPNERPTFSQIVEELETRNSYDKEYQSYIGTLKEKQKSLVFDKIFSPFKEIDLSEYKYCDKVFDSDLFFCMKTEQKKCSGDATNSINLKVFQKEIEEFSIDEINHLLTELKILDQFRHRAIAGFIGFSLYDIKGYLRPVIATETVDKGSLHDYLSNLNMNEFIDWNWANKLIIIYDIASAMKHLHQNNIINRDLSSKNIFLDDHLHPKLFDFNMCFDVSNEKDIDKVDCMKKSDVYSFGLVVYEILTNKAPYEDCSTLSKSSQSSLQFGKEISFHWRNLIENCLKHFPFDRPSFDEIVFMLKKPNFVSVLQSEDEKEKFFDHIYSFEKEDDSNIINIYKYRMVCKVCENLDSTIFKIQEKSTGKYYSAKINQRETSELDEKFISQKEVDKICSKFYYPSLLKYVGYSPFDFEYNPFLTIVDEYAQISLHDILKKNEQFEGWNYTKKLINIYGIAAGMRYIHSQGYIHRNLTTKNILEDENFYPKITGFSKIISQKDGNDKDFFCYPSYSAPEVISDKRYTMSSDVYSFSMILYEIIMNKKPFDKFKSDFQIYDAVSKGYRPKIDKSVPKCYKNLIEKCWSKNQKSRPTFSEIICQLKTDEEFILYDADPDEFYKYTTILNNQINEEEIFNDNNYIKINDYEKLEKIGEGSFAKIFKVREKKTGEIYIAKIQKSDNNKLKEDQKYFFLREIKIMFQSRHPTILNFKGFSPVNFSYKPHNTIFLEYTSNGSLGDILKLEKDGCSPPEWNLTQKHISIFGIALGMEYLHSLNIIHRDLKPENVLLDDYLFPKISDFGLSKKLHYNENSLTLHSGHGVKGTPVFMAPEIIDNFEYSKASDVYSFSMTIFRILSNEEIFNGEYNIQLMKKITHGERPKFPSSFPEQYRKLIERCWSQEPANRPTFSEIVQILKTEEFLKYIGKQKFNDYVEYCENENTAIRFNKVKSERKAKKDISEEDVYPSNAQMIDLDQFDKQEKIGSGGFGKVYKVADKTTKQIYAAKIMRNELVDLNERDLINFKRELEIISNIQHVSIMKFIGYSPIDFKQNHKPVIISEIVLNGTLSSVLFYESQGRAIDGWDDTKKLINIYGIAAAMKYMHSKSLLHRDLKPENILLDEFLYPKLADFGLSKGFSPKVCEMNSGILGTPPYVAPEILCSNEYSKASDVYAFSLIVYEIMTNEKPLVELRNKENIWYNVALKHYRPKFKGPIPKCYKDLIEICWSEDPYERPSFDEIVNILRSDPDFITDNIDLDEFIDYSEYIGESYLQQKGDLKEDLKEESAQAKPAKSTVKISTADAQEKINERTLTEFHRIVETEISNQSIGNYFLDLNDYEIKNLIRRGEFNKVYEVVQKETGTSYSARLSNIDMTLFNEEEMTNIAREFYQISLLSHPAILHFVGFSPRSFKNEPKPVVISELSPSKTLNDIIQTHRSNIRISGWNSTNKLITIYGIASAMKHLHSHGIIHRNLTPNSINMSNSFQPKITDFGLCTHLLMINTLTFQTSSVNQESSIYSAPEILISEEHTKESDVYAFSMIAYEIITKEKPRKKSSRRPGNAFLSMDNCVELEFKSSTPECYRNLIEQGLSANPDERPTFDQIVSALENEPEFITQGVNKYKYLNYIKSLSSAK